MQPGPAPMTEVALLGVEEVVVVVDLVEEEGEDTKLPPYSILPIKKNIY